MLAEYEEYQRQVTSQSLRLVMMSGDWVPVSLPGRIRNLFQNVEIVAQMCIRDSADPAQHEEKSGQKTGARI